MKSRGIEGGVALPSIGGLESITEYYNGRDKNDANTQRKIATAAGTTRPNRAMLQTI